MNMRAVGMLTGARRVAMLLLAVMTSAVAMAELTYSTNIDEGGTITIDGTTVSVTPNENYSIESVILYITNRPGILGAGLELTGRKVGDIYIYHVVRDGQVVVTFRPNTDAVHVTFNMNNHGTAILDKELILDQTVDCPNDPTAEGYVFMGWFTDEECTKPYDFNTTLKNSLSFDHTNFYYTLTLYAKWVAESNLYGGCGKVDVEAGLDGSQVTWALSKSDGSDNYDILTISGNGQMADYKKMTQQPGHDFRTQIKTIIIGKGVKSIGNNAFNGFSSLTSVTFEDNSELTSIGEKAFYKCTGLTSFSIPEGVTTIGGSAFKYCTGLTSFSIPESVTTIGSYAFKGCTGLTSITIPASVTTIGDEAFSKTGWYKAQPDGVLYLDNWLIGYKGDQPTGEIIIKDGTKGIADYVFCECTDLTSVIIPGSVTIIGNNVFEGCTSLVSLNIPSSVTTIGRYAFYGCTSLDVSSLTIPGSATIGEEAFEGCLGSPVITDFAATVTHEENGTTVRNGYNSLNEAFDNAQDGDVVTLFDDCTVTVDPDNNLDGYIRVKAFDSDDPIALDLNGHTIAFPDNGNFIVDNEARLTITDSSNGGKITSSGCYAIYNGMTGFLTIEDGMVESIYEGDGNEAVKSAIYNSGTMFVEGGAISGKIYGIYNDGTLNLSDGLISASDGIGVYNNENVVLWGLPTFNCKNEDIALAKDKIIYLGGGHPVGAAPEKKIKIGIQNVAPYAFTYGYHYLFWNAETGVFVEPQDVFVSSQWGENFIGEIYCDGIYEAGIAGLTEITFPAGKSTYFDDRALALYEANDQLKFYTVTGVDETSASVSVTEYEGKLFGEHTPLIVSNETGEEITAKFIEAFEGPMASYYSNIAIADLNDLEDLEALYELDEVPTLIYYGFEGTNVDLEEAIDYELQDPEKNYFYPIKGLTYYGFNGTGFVRLSRLGPIAAHRCWLGLGEPQYDEPEAARSLSVSWPDGSTTGISEKRIVNQRSTAEGWYGIDGRKYNSEPTGKGIYIRRNGNKAEKLIIK